MKKLIFIISLLSLWAGAFDVSARYKGDLNGDDRVDLADMVYLAKAIKAGSTDKALDVNTSGKVDDNDLQKLADIIISGVLIEDTGMNVGIGGWDDSGEDFGGTVKAPAIRTRSIEETRFYMSNPKSNEEEQYEIEFGISEGSVAPAAILFNIKLPGYLRFDKTPIVELENEILATHKLYGTPKSHKEYEDDYWSDCTLRFIIFSPDLEAIAYSVGKLGKIHYSVDEEGWCNLLFQNCNIVAEGAEDWVALPEHWEGPNRFMPVEISSIWFDQSELNLTEGDEWWLYPNIDPWDATDRNLEWTSSDESVATVSSYDGINATIKALKGGETVITATASNGVSAVCKVTVTQKVIELEAIRLNAESLDLEVGDTFRLMVEFVPADATYQDLEWLVNNETIATIDQTGLVTVLSEGETTVIVRSAYWTGVEASCLLNVTSAVEGLIEENAPCDVFTTNGVLLKKDAALSDIDSLRPGIYILRQGLKITKLLK